jgi:hypothetical protein
MVVAAVLVPIGARLRLEWRLDRAELRAETAQHVFQHAIAADAQSLAGDLNIDVAIADVPGKPGELLRARRRDLDQSLALAGNPHDRAILEHETVPVAQHGRVRQIKQELHAAFTCEHNAAAMPLAGIEHDAIDDAGVVYLRCARD